MAVAVVEVEVEVVVVVVGVEERGGKRTNAQEVRQVGLPDFRRSLRLPSSP